MERLEGRAAAGLGPSSRSLLGTAAWLPGLLALVAWSAPDTAYAWVYPEHRDIAVLAVEKLDPQRRAVFDSLVAAKPGSRPREAPVRTGA